MDRLHPPVEVLRARVVALGLLANWQKMEFRNSDDEGEDASADDGDDEDAAIAEDSAASRFVPK